MKTLITRTLGLGLNTLAVLMPRAAGRLGFRLFCRPFRTPLKTYQRTFLETAERFNFRQDGVKIQAYRWGHGPRNVLFVHGWQSHSFRWKAYIEALPKDDYTIYAFDAPGHGLSGGNYLSVPYYGSVIQQLMETIGPLHALVGHSLGSFASLYTLRQAPASRTTRLVLMAPPGEAMDFFTFYKQTLRLSDRALNLVMDYFKKEFKVPVSYFSMSAFAAGHSGDGMIIHDEDDPETAYHHAQRIHSAWPQAQLIPTKGLGHNLKSPSVVNLVTQYITDPANVEKNIGALRVV